MTDCSVKMSAQHQIKSQNKKKHGIMRKEVESCLQDDSVWKAENEGRSMTENHSIMSNVEDVNKHWLIAISSNTNVAVSITPS